MRQDAYGVPNAVTLHALTGDDLPEPVIDAPEFSCSTAASM
jgi:hypothetical protein